MPKPIIHANSKIVLLGRFCIFCIFPKTYQLINFNYLDKNGNTLQNIFIQLL